MPLAGAAVVAGAADDVDTADAVDVLLDAADVLGTAAGAAAAAAGAATAGAAGAGAGVAAAAGGAAAADGFGALGCMQRRHIVSARVIFNPFACKSVNAPS